MAFRGFHMKNMLVALGGVVAALALAPAANATTYPVGSPNFFITNGTPFSPSIRAIFFNSFDSSTNFDDSFTFTIPQNGVGSGSISTSFSSAANKLTISSLFINGQLFNVPANDGGQSTSVNGIPIVSGQLNTIRVIGSTVGAGDYTGTATFSAAAVPETATWAMMVVGFGAAGATMRSARKRKVSLA